MNIFLPWIEFDGITEISDSANSLPNQVDLGRLSHAVLVRVPSATRNVCSTRRKRMVGIGVVWDIVIYHVK